MSLEQIFTLAWQRKSIWLYVLLPLSWLYGLMVWIRRQLYRLGWLKSYRAPVPVMVVGNITVGGAGKTPLVIALVKHLQASGVQLGVISRGYGAQVADSRVPRLVTQTSTPDQVGDEPCEIVSETAVPMCVSSNRQAAIETLLERYPQIQLIMSDDGLQHYRMHRDIEWAVVDDARGFGNAKLLPAGFLREPLSRLKQLNVIYHIRHAPETKTADDKIFTMQLEPAPLQLLFTKCRDAQGQTQSAISTSLIKPKAPIEGDVVHAVAGIGYPTRFFDSLRALGFKPVEHPHDDHGCYGPQDFCFEGYLADKEAPSVQPHIVTTAKDAVKLRQIFKPTDEVAQRIWVLPVSAKLSRACYDLLGEQLKEVGVFLGKNSQSH